MVSNKHSIAEWVYSLLFLTVIAFSCQHDPLIPLEDAPKISFSNDVQPIIISNCTQSGCHGSGGGEFRLISYSDVVNRVSAGSPHKSELYKTITANAFGQMPPPPNPHLSDQELKTIFLWIAQGAQNN